MNLYELFAQAKAEAQKALESGDLEKGKEWRAKAEGYQAAIKELEAVKGLSVTQTAPVRPPLPGVGEGNMPGAAKSEAQPDTNPLVKSFYVKRFGTPVQEAHALLVDIEGADYMQKYFDHRQAWVKYLRMGQENLDAQERRILKNPVYTPGAVIDALESGIDSARYLKSTMVEAVDNLGGYVVPIDVQTNIIERMAPLTVVRPRANVVGTSRDTVQYPVSTGGDGTHANAVRVFWVDESPTSTTAATNLTYGQENIPIHTVMAHTTVSKNLLEDAAYPLEAHLMRSFAQEMAIDEDNQFVAGDGNGKPQGVLSGTSNALSLSYGVVSAAGTIDWDGLIDTAYTLDSVYRQRASWMAEKATYEAIAKLKDGNGDYLWRERFGNQVTEGVFMQRLLGFPAFEQEAMPTIASNAFAMIFGDWMGYTIADRVGMSVQRYDDSTTGKANQVVFICRRRLGGQVTEEWRFVLLKLGTS